MGSSASGNRRPSRFCTDQAVAIDVRALSKAGALRTGVACELSIKGQGRIAQCIVLDDLSFDLVAEDSSHPKFARVQLVRTPCHFGGSRPWALCPRCERRVAIVYLSQGGLACRSCADLRYRSQRDTCIDRLVGRLARSRAKLGGNIPRAGARSVKPARMHWRTYAALARSYLASEQALVQAVFGPSS